MNLRKIALAAIISAVTFSALATASATNRATDIRLLEKEFQNAETMTQAQHDFCVNRMPEYDQAFIVVAGDEDIYGVSLPEYFCTQTRFADPEISKQDDLLVINVGQMSTVLAPTDDGADYVPFVIDGTQVTASNELRLFTKKLKERNDWVKATHKIKTFSDGKDRHTLGAQK